MQLLDPSSHFMAVLPSATVKSAIHDSPHRKHSSAPIKRKRVLVPVLIPTSIIHTPVSWLVFTSQGIKSSSYHTC